MADVTVDLRLNTSAEFEEHCARLVARVRLIGDAAAERLLGCSIDSIAAQMRDLVELRQGNDVTNFYAVPSERFREIVELIGA
jgi:hypothetical protein